MSDRTPDIAVVKKALRVACRAPSLHNSQPWHWVFDGHALRLFVDRHRLVNVADRSGRETIISCGAVLNHARIAMAAAGWQANIDRFPDPESRDHLATMVFRPLDCVTESQRSLAESILERRTDRLPLRRPTYWRWLLPELLKALDAGIVMLDEISDEARPRLARASRLTEVLHCGDASYQAELHWWTAPFALYEGVPPATLATASEAARVDVRRDFPVVSSLDRHRNNEVDRSKILVLSTTDDSRSSVLGSGEVLSRLLLECTMAGMATCTLTHLIELDESRDIVRCLISQRGEPQALIRVGIAPPMEQLPAATPRLPMDEVLEISCPVRQTDARDSDLAP
ncbi:NAD(P)H nitroreductase [Mycobacterium sp.]|uniref:Acg family FMN-binding oxidoreductase n=1 Tax=Mycobacterium sp. TaxID=1785 RepID=UPI0031D842A5